MDLKISMKNLFQQTFPHASPRPSRNSIFSLKQPELLQSFLQITRESHVIVKTVGLKYNLKQ